MKLWTKILFALLATVSAIGQSVTSQELTGGATTGTVLLSSRGIVEELTLVSATAGTQTIKFYDMNLTNTTFTNLATVSLASAAYTNSTTNVTAEGYTNIITVVGVQTTETVVPSATLELPRILTVVLPGNSSRTIDFNRILVRGLSAVASPSNVTVEVQYRPLR